jgi:hypothetical protein
MCCPCSIEAAVRAGVRFRGPAGAVYQRGLALARIGLVAGTVKGVSG